MNWQTLLGIAVAVMVALSFLPQMAEFISRARQALPAKRPDAVVSKPIAVADPPLPTNVQWVKSIIEASQGADPQFILDHLLAGATREQVMVDRIAELVLKGAATAAAANPSPAAATTTATPASA